MAGVMQIDAINAANHTDFIARCPSSISTGSTVEQWGRERENWVRLGTTPYGMKPMRRSERSHARPVTRRVLLAILAAIALVAADIPGTDSRAAERPLVAG